jgi:hypothetical protein
MQRYDKQQNTEKKRNEMKYQEFEGGSTVVSASLAALRIDAPSRSASGDFVRPSATATTTQ